jgi:hypothetical protein
VTGAVATTEPTEPLSAFSVLERPAVLLVGDPAAETPAYQKLLEGIFQSEKICSGMRAFQALRITDENAQADPMLKEHTKTVPCVLVLDPVKERIVALRKSRIKISRLWKEMKRAAGHAWVESLDRCVRTHLRLLVERDRLHDARCVLADRLSREEDKEKRSGIEVELLAVDGELATLRDKERSAWVLTPKWKPPTVIRDPELNPLASVLPDGWEEHKTDEGKTYYEAPDGRTTWKRPSIN